MGGGPGKRLSVAPRRPPEALLATALAISQEAEEDWKAAAAIDTSAATGALDATVPIAQLGEWISLRKQLAGIPAIRQTEVRSLGVGAARVTLHHSGTPQQLQAVLAQAGIALVQEPGGWVLRSTGATGGRQP